MAQAPMKGTASKDGFVHSILLTGTLARSTAACAAGHEPMSHCLSLAAGAGQREPSRAAPASP